MVVWLCLLPFTLVEQLGVRMVPVFSLTAFLVLKVEQLAVEIENPFGHDFNDLPLDAFCLTVEADALRTMNELDNVPGSAAGRKWRRAALTMARRAPSRLAWRRGARLSSP